MGRALLVLDTPADRQKASHWITKAPVGTRVEFKASKRSLPQNDLMWALLTEFSQQFKPNGKTYDPAQWKAIFLHAFGREITFLPSLDGKTFLPIEMSSSDLSKQEMTDFIEFIIKEAADRDIILQNPKDNTESGTPQPDIADAPPPASGTEEAGNPDPVSSPNSNSEASIPVEASDTAGDPPPSPSGSPATETEREILIRFARDVLPMAADTTISPSAAKAVEKEWAAQIKELSPDGIAKARTISESMRLISNNPAKLSGVLERYARELETTVEDLGG